MNKRQAAPSTAAHATSPRLKKCHAAPAEEQQTTKRISTTALLARAMLENTALLHKLKEVFDQRDTLGPHKLNDILIQMVFSTREWDDFPQAISILTHIDKLDKTVKHARHMYNTLSELAHPNWMGVCGTYSRTDKQKFEIHFGPTDVKVIHHGATRLLAHLLTNATRPASSA